MVTYNRIYHVIIKKDGIYYIVREEHNWDDTILEKIPFDKHNTFRALRKGCEIEKGVTLRDIMTIVRDNKILSEFIGAYSSCDIDAWHAGFK